MIQIFCPQLTQGTSQILILRARNQKLKTPINTYNKSAKPIAPPTPRKVTARITGPRPPPARIHPTKKMMGGAIKIPIRMSSQPVGRSALSVGTIPIFSLSTSSLYISDGTAVARRHDGQSKLNASPILSHFVISNWFLCFISTSSSISSGL